jgi:hypothetical protein
VAQKLRSLRKALASELDEARKALLVNVIETYLPLEGAEAQEMQRQLGQQETRELTAMLTIYEERGIVKGILRGKRQMLLSLMRQKFGELPEALRAQVEAIQKEEEIDALSNRFVTADSLEAMGLEQH